MLMIFCISCEKKNDNIEISHQRKTFLIIGDTIDCNYFESDSLLMLSQNDSIDINFDEKNEIEFNIVDTVIDNCEEIFNNCPPGAICDCWPYYLEKYIIKVPNDYEIVTKEDSTIRKFEIGDTLSNENIWVKGIPIIFYTGDIAEPMENENNFILGIRNIQESDTIYSWIKIAIINHEIGIKKITTQK